MIFVTEKIKYFDGQHKTVGEIPGLE